MKPKNLTKKILMGFIVVLFIVILLIYKNYNPEIFLLFPKCPFKLLTGLKCAGCGSQRAIHNLLNLKINSAFKENALLISFLPYIFLGLLYDFFKPQNKYIIKIHKILYRGKAVFIVLTIIVLFWVLRNIFV